MRRFLSGILVAGLFGLAAACSGVQAGGPAHTAPGMGGDVTTGDGEPLTPPAATGENDDDPMSEDAEESLDSEGGWGEGTEELGDDEYDDASDEEDYEMDEDE